MQLSLINEKKKDGAVSKDGKKKIAKQVPEVAASAKFIMAEKKESDKEREKAEKAKK